MRFLVFGVVPYVAFCGAALSWDFGYDKDFLNQNARMGALLIITDVAANVWIVTRSWQRRREASVETSPNSPSA
jgi:hypothetical protein